MRIESRVKCAVLKIACVNFESAIKGRIERLTTESSDRHET